MSWLRGTCVSLLLLLLAVQICEGRRLRRNDGFTPAFDENSSATTLLQPHSVNKRHWGFRACWGWILLGCWGGGGHRAPAATPPPRPTQVNGAWSQWTYYGRCSKTCGAGTRPAVRYCNNPAPAHCGKYCPGSNRGTVYCNCKPCAVNGGWSGWTPVGACSNTAGSSTAVVCGTGSQKYARTCSNPAASGGGSTCAGNSDKVVACNSGTPCAACTAGTVPDRVTYTSNGVTIGAGGSVASGSTLNSECSIGFQGQATVFTCTNGQFAGSNPVCTDVNECASGDGGCDADKTFCINNVGSFKCQCKPGLQVDQSGNCVDAKVNGNWGAWTPSGGCSVTCGGGRQKFVRSCDNPPPSNGGSPCSGDSDKLEDCNAQCCPVDGQWSAWVDGACSKTCGSGVMGRTRTCDGQSCGGQSCEGDANSQAACATDPCEACTIPTATGGVIWQTEPGQTEVPDRGVLQYVCDKGFEQVGFGSITCKGKIWEGVAKCEDVNECTDNLNDCNPETAVCQNTAGSFTCSCKTGYEKDPDTSDCNDIDECKDDSMNKCEQGCTNSFGGYTCYCKPGHILRPDERRCKSNKCTPFPKPFPTNAPRPACVFLNENDKSQKTCTVTCFKGFKHPDDGREEVYTCTDGVWDFDKTGVDPPDCVEDDDLGLNLNLNIPTGEGCDPGAGTYGTVDGAGGQADAQCQGGRKRGVGQLVAHLEKHVRLEECAGKDSFAEFKECALGVARGHRDAWKADIESKLNNGEITMTIVDKDTGNSRTITLEVPEGGLTVGAGLGCATGSIVSRGEDGSISCVKCSAGYFFDADNDFCEPCPKNTFSEEAGLIGSESCQPCPEGLSTRRMGSSECAAPCEPGSYEDYGLQPCIECEQGSYQPDVGAKFCIACPFGTNTTEPGALELSQCGCPDGKFWQDCSKDCRDCQNGGVCEVDGKCACPKGWTGVDCSNIDPNPPCQDYYFVKFFKNAGGNINNSILFVTPDDNDGLIDLRVGNDKTGEGGESGTLPIDAGGYQTQTLPSDSPVVLQVAVYPEDNLQILSYSETPDSTGVFSALPLQSLSPDDFEEYRVISHSIKVTKNTPKNSPDRKYFSTVMVVSGQDDTEVEITPTQNGKAVVSSTGQTIKLKRRKAKKFTLSQYETITVTGAAGKDLSGTKVKASSPVACYSGHECGRYITKNKNCDYMTEQLPPVRQWGSSYIVTPFFDCAYSSLVKIVSSETASVDLECKNSGNGKSTLKKTVTVKPGLAYKLTMKQSVYCSITSSKPVLVGQITSSDMEHFLTSPAQEAQHQSAIKQGQFYGGPAFNIIPPLSTRVTRAPFLCPQESRRNYFNLVMPKSEYDPEHVLLDARKVSTIAGFKTIDLKSPAGDFVMLSGEVGKGYHSLKTTTEGAGFYLTVYGMDLNAAYSYSLGLNQAMSCSNLKE